LAGAAPRLRLRSSRPYSAKASTRSLAYGNRCSYSRARPVRPMRDARAVRVLNLVATALQITGLVLLLLGVTNVCVQILRRPARLSHTVAQSLGRIARRCYTAQVPLPGFEPGRRSVTAVRFRHLPAFQPPGNRSRPLGIPSRLWHNCGAPSPLIAAQRRSALQRRRSAAARPIPPPASRTNRTDRTPPTGHHRR
jgi:hypothetical protein